MAFLAESTGRGGAVCLPLCARAKRERINGTFAEATWRRHAPAFRIERQSQDFSAADSRPCSRTAPCKTFAGAISKTAAGGEINCLDSAGYGAVTITKGISIVCNGVVGSVLVSGTTRLEGSPQDLLRREDFEELFLGAGPAKPARGLEDKEKDER